MNNTYNESTIIIPPDQYIIHHLNEVPHNFIMDYIVPPNSNNNNTTTSSSRRSMTSHNSLYPNTNTNDRNTLELYNNYIITMEEQISSIMMEYDFLIITERIDECMVELSYLMNIPMQYFVTISSKSSNSYLLRSIRRKYNTTKGKPRKKYYNELTCIPLLVSPIATLGIQNYFHNNGTLLLSSNSIHTNHSYQMKTIYYMILPIDHWI